jgi:hypothetical protein
MQNHPEEEILSSRPVLEMLTVANEYCLFFEKAENYNVEDILTYFQRIAPLLYLKGSLLPAVEADEDTFSERYVTEEQWEAIFKILRQKFDHNDVYYVHDHNFDTVQVSLADNLADIYQDMKDFVMLYQKNISFSRQNALAQIRVLFYDHWGLRVLDALRAVHYLLFREKIDPDLFGEEA